MAQDGGQRLDVHPMGQGIGCESMSEIMKAKVRKPCLFQQDLHPFIGGTRACRLLRLPWMGEDPFCQSSLFAFSEQCRSAGRQMNATGSRSSFGILGGQLAALLLMDHAADLQRAMSFIKVLPLQPANLTPAQSGSQFRVEEVTPDTIPLNGFHEFFQLFICQHLFSFVAEFGCVDISGGITWDEASLLRCTHYLMEHSVNASDCSAGQPLSRVSISLTSQHIIQLLNIFSGYQRDWLVSHIGTM